MLKQRIITGVILIYLVYFAVYKLSFEPFMLAVDGVLLLASFEWGRLFSKTSRVVSVFLYPLSLLLTLLAEHKMLFAPYFSLFSLALLGLVSLGWIGMTILFIVRRFAHQALPRFGALGLFFIGLFVFNAFWVSLYYLKTLQIGGAGHVVAFAILIICASDIGAYFTGKICGRNKLFPEVSPGKTWEGFAGGLVFSLFIVYAFHRYFIFSLAPISVYYLYLISATVVIVSVVGDLFESHLKRQVGLKDSSQLLPGHGGLLDRLDSLLAALPMFTLGFVLGTTYIT